MPWRACCGPDFIEILKPWIKKRTNRIEVTDGGDAANGKAGLRPDQRGVSLTKRFLCDRTCLCVIHFVSTCGDEQDRLTRGFAPKNYRFGDLVDMASGGGGSFGGGAGLLVHLVRGDVQPSIAQRLRHPFEAFAHYLHVLFSPD